MAPGVQALQRGEINVDRAAAEARELARDHPHRPQQRRLLRGAQRLAVHLLHVGGHHGEFDVFREILAAEHACKVQQAEETEFVRSPRRHGSLVIPERFGRSCDRPEMRDATREPTGFAQPVDQLLIVARDGRIDAIRLVAHAQERRGRPRHRDDPLPLRAELLRERLAEPELIEEQEPVHRLLGLARCVDGRALPHRSREPARWVLDLLEHARLSLRDAQRAAGLDPVPLTLEGVRRQLDPQPTLLGRAQDRPVDVDAADPEPAERLQQEAIVRRLVVPMRQRGDRCERS